MRIDREQLEKEVRAKAVLSGKKGGQHVNKVATQVQLFFSIAESEMFTEEEKQRLEKKLEGKLSAAGTIMVASDGSRSQGANREDAMEKLATLLETALKKPRPRKKTKVPNSVKRKRLDQKKQRGEIKKSRRKPD